MLPQVDRPGTLEKVITSLQAVLKLLRPFDEPNTWQNMKLQGDWAHASAPSGADAHVPQYVVDPLGRVELRGWTITPSAASQVICQLPPGARPSRVVGAAASSTAGTFLFLNVHSSGLVVVVPLLAPGDAVCLDGVRFDTRV